MIGKQWVRKHQGTTWAEECGSKDHWSDRMVCIECNVLFDSVGKQKQCLNV